MPDRAPNDARRFADLPDLQSSKLRSLRALPITEIEDMLMTNAAMMGGSRMPKTG